MSLKEEEILANFNARRRGARVTARGDANQPVEQAPNTLAT